MRGLAIIVFLSVVAVSVFGSCARELEKEIEAAVEEPLKEEGERVVGGFSHIQTEEGRVVLKLEGDSVSGLGQETVTIQNPRVERFFYEGDEKNSVELEASKGLWNKDSGQVEMEKDVKGVIRFEEEIIIHHADSVCYEAKKHTIILEGRVKIERMRDILNADKVTIYLDEGHKEIIKVVAEGNVTGRIFPEK